MNKKVDLVEREVEFVDLGDTAEETRQTAPAPITPDWPYGWGYPSK